ncbi:hypothetical protein Moror_2458 [Moniliophthora roreri MCA 2997]|uniref:Uncharacterized protein n=1 Tax=Moniliophthora roreri (strain MCA 2997) TaxID=1381753 RepID=V2Y287_MONRO|nr:hypothetical protein Moror_2458 [Moniliophthora roreri MCA 2997]
MFEILDPAILNVKHGWASFNWTLEPGGPLQIGIWMYQGERQVSCPQDERNSDLLEEMQNVVPLINLAKAATQPQQIGEEFIRVYNDGNATLCAYSFTLVGLDLNNAIQSMIFETSKNVTFKYEGHYDGNGAPLPSSTGTEGPTTSVPASSSQDGSSTQGSPNLSDGDIAGIVVGIAAFLALLAGLYLVYRRLRNRKGVSTFDQERMVRAQVPLASTRVASPTVQETVISKETSASQSVSTLPGPKEKLG